MKWITYLTVIYLPANFVAVSQPPEIYACFPPSDEVFFLPPPPTDSVWHESVRFQPSRSPIGRVCRFLDLRGDLATPDVRHLDGLQNVEGLS